jgi:DNA polymerase III epsilon subunit-like protein|tara:strand:- start:628 stop:1212 length:585 start_codon:yes stop_codon:yes gene_type:complete
VGNFASSKAVTFLDIETTQLDPKKSAILQISFITDWENGKQDSWSTKIKPKPIELEFASKEALAICNYTEEGWENAPSFSQVAGEIAKRLTWGPLVAHNINFDLSHIRAVFARYKWTEVDSVKNLDDEQTFKVGYPIIDTCALAYLFLPTERQNLNELRQYFNISTDGAHEAVKDTEDCRTVFYNIIGEKLDKD